MCRILQIFFFFILFSSSFFAEEDSYSYRFQCDTVISGALVAEGDIFPNSETTFISIYNTYQNDKILPYIKFLDKNFSTLEKISFKLNQNIKLNPLVFDFDGDSYDEVIFAITEPNKIWYLYLDPSNTPSFKKKILELPNHKENPNSINTHITPVQLDKDGFYELIFTVGERILNKFTFRGMWAFDLEKSKMLWENMTAENLIKSEPINIITDSSSYLIFSSSSEHGMRSLAFSNGYYFFVDRDGNKTSYNKYFEKNSTVLNDTNSKDYSVDSIAIVRAIDSQNNKLWERIVGGRAIQTKIDSITINNEKRIVLSILVSQQKSGTKNSIEIIKPNSGDVEKKIEFDKWIKSTFVSKESIIVSFADGEIKVLDFGLNPKSQTYSDYWYKPFAKAISINESLLLNTEGTSVFRSLIALDDDLNKVAKFTIKGLPFYFENSKLISIFDVRIRKSKLISIQSIPWYNRVSPILFRNLTISFLTILLVTMLLWINTLRVSSNKIKKQKEEIEDTHAELKETTSKLIRAEKLAVYGTIASGIAHEINSPLGAIINSAQRIKNSKDANLEKNIALIEKAGKRSKAIIEKLLLNTRKNIDDKTLFIEVFNDWMELSRKQFDNLGIKFISDINCNNMLAISSTELNQIFTNLLFNARDAITENNSSVKEICILAKKKDDYCTLLIKDTGDGFSEERLKNPFEAFETSKEKGKGTGLGLWVVKSILENINGSIEIRNCDKGAEVEVNIPLFNEGNR